ncbi:LOW QUALITY PROTEIN: granzyme H-like [Erinaceus europaeus]|uniref:LOW QUALITY PROTEIN: granzyme H-like n=1 Tax=Erinaceus europaeus TaxID=9365 RepID=A0ABM3W0T0_ERIEU|nr:LOW QUALITY PROTEIN: granzyme H-like [Erinaceus europaeus]
MLLLLLAFLLSPGAVTEEIIGGHEAKCRPHPYMALVKFLTKDSWKRCGGILVWRDFVLQTATHCWGSSITVTLGAHNISKPESTQQVINVNRAFRHPDYNSKNLSNDIMLLKLMRKAKLTSAVKPLSLPSPRAQMRPGQVCSVASWGMVVMGTLATTLQEVHLTVQKKQMCEASIFQGFYSRDTQICVGDQNKMKSSFKKPPMPRGPGDLVCGDNSAQGIFTYGQRNGTPPGVFIKISSLLPWVRRTMRHPLHWRYGSQ